MNPSSTPEKDSRLTVEMLTNAFQILDKESISWEEILKEYGQLFREIFRKDNK